MSIILDSLSSQKTIDIEQFITLFKPNSIIKFGFTGTRSGMNADQKTNISLMLDKLINMNCYIEVHHGDCFGADTDFHNICLSKNIKIIIHPPTDTKLRSFCISQFIEKPKKYLDRNKRIVDDTDYLIACPYSFDEVLRSGTWSTIRYARKNNKSVLLL